MHQTLTATVPETAWRHALPVLSANGLTLREIRNDDASTLLAMLAIDDVSRFMSPLPPTLDAFDRFVAWVQEQRSLGIAACFVVVPDGGDSPAGIFHIRSMESGFITAEWGFAIGSPFWGSGLFARSARLVIDFAFGTLGVLRLEARACAENRRGNGALRKLGATPEGVLRRSFHWNGKYHDQVLWSILDCDWAASSSEPAR
jgi:RimJ/RimL family protein N-acetyltransferase